MSGAVCFRRTRVPVEFVFDFLPNGTMDEFYEDYPNVKPEGAARRGRGVERVDRRRVPGRGVRLLLDNCVRRDLKPHFAPLEALHTIDLGWETLRNGDLLRQANERFDVLVTVDKNMRFQSNLRGMRSRVAVLDVKGNDLSQLIAATKTLLPRLATLPEGEFTVVTL